MKEAAEGALGREEMWPEGPRQPVAATGRTTNS